MTPRIALRICLILVTAGASAACAPAGEEAMAPQPPPVPLAPAVPGASFLPPTSEATSEAETVSVLTFDQHAQAKMRTPLLNLYREGQPSVLVYSVFFAGGGQFSFQLPYDGKVDLARVVGADVDVEERTRLDLTAPGASGQPLMYSSAIGGHIEVAAQGAEVRVTFRGVQLKEATGGRTRVVETGEVVGRVDRRCLRRVVVDSPQGGAGSVPAFDVVADPDWSSPFCQQHR
jgi:hypothetical protein